VKGAQFIDIRHNQLKRNLQQMKPEAKEAAQHNNIQKAKVLSLEEWVEKRDEQRGC